MTGALGIANVSTANKTNVTAPTKPLMIANLIAFGFCIGCSPINPEIVRKGLSC